MRTFLIVMKIIFSIFGIIWNCFVKLINMIISAWNKYVRARNDRINRGVTEIKSSTYDRCCRIIDLLKMLWCQAEAHR